MKKRIQIDGMFAMFLVILTGCLFFWKNFYITNEIVSSIVGILGFIFIFLGGLLRMAARGHKKKNSQRGRSLVMSGPYLFVRNPMYLGSLLIGSGFVILFWPWWILPIFVVFFWLRFNPQMVKEEKSLVQNFKGKYEDYCRKAGRLFPRLKSLKETKVKAIFNWPEALSTNEKNTLLTCLGLAFFLRIIQQKIILGRIHWTETFLLFVSAVFIMVVISGVEYRRKDN